MGIYKGAPRDDQVIALSWAATESITKSYHIILNLIITVIMGRVAIPAPNFGSIILAPKGDEKSATDH